jgi:hypothetical protein
MDEKRNAVSQSAIYISRESSPPLSTRWFNPSDWRNYMTLKILLLSSGDLLIGIPGDDPRQLKQPVLARFASSILIQESRIKGAGQPIGLAMPVYVNLQIDEMTVHGAIGECMERDPNSFHVQEYQRAMKPTEKKQLVH